MWKDPLTMGTNTRVWNPDLSESGEKELSIDVYASSLPLISLAHECNRAPGLSTTDSITEVPFRL